MELVAAINVHQDDNLAIQESEGHQTLLAVCPPPILTGDGRQVPDGLGAFKVETVVSQVR